MPYILHYLEIKGNHEYIVITEEDDSTDVHELYCRQGFTYRNSYEIESTGTLPTETILTPDY